jgi:hypothetical protein
MLHLTKGRGLFFTGLKSGTQEPHCCKSFKFFFLLFIVVLGRVHCSIYNGFLKFIKYIILEFIPFTIFLYPRPILEIVSTGISFSIYIHVYTVLHHIHLPTPFPYLLSSPTGTNPVFQVE